MNFDLKKFKSSKLEPRQEAVLVPDLKEYFKEGAEAVWIVRGLSGHELGKVNEAAEKNKNMAAIIEGFAGGNAKEQVDALKASLGLDDGTPNDVVRRLEMLTIGSVDPAIDHEMSVRLCTFFPIEFYTLTNAITKLTGQGAEVKKKPQPSTGVQKSETP